MIKSNIPFFLVLVFLVLPGACTYNDDLWNRASDKIDDVAPDVSYIDPDDGLAGITIPCAIRFNDNMMHSSLNTGTITVDDGSGAVSGSWDPVDIDVTGGQQTIARFTPSGGLFTRGENYTITVSTDVRDYYGNYMEAEWSDSFSVSNNLELTASNVDVSNPADHQIRLTFNDPPANGWQISVYDSDGILAASATPNIYTNGMAGVESSTTSQYITIASGVTFTTGSTVTVETFTSFFAAIDSAVLNDPGTESITVPAPAP